MSESMSLVDQHGKPMMSIGSPDSAHYSASQSARELRGWHPMLMPADSDINPERNTISARALDLDRNNGVAQGARITSNDNVVGTGLNVSPKPNYRVLGKTAEWATEWAKDVKAHWNDYAESRHFDAAGQLNFHLATQQVYNTAYLQGEAIAVPMWNNRVGTKYKTCFKLIDPVRLSNPNDLSDTPNRRGGIDQNNDGRPLRYWIRNSHPNDYGIGAVSGRWTSIPAYHRNGRQRFIHVYKKDRPGQSRAVSRASAVLASFGMAGSYQITELQAAIVNSKIAGFIESNMSAAEVMEMFGGEQGELTPKDFLNGRNEWRGTLDSGTLLQLPLGDKFSSHVPNRPATGYADYMERIAREIGAGLGLPYELIMRDFSKTNYSSARAALLEAWRHFSVEREWLAFSWANACYSLWLEEAIERGAVEGEGFYENKSAYCRAKWLGLGHQPIDPLKHQKANSEALSNHTDSLENIYAEKGEDWEDGLRQIAKEKELKQQLGLTDSDIEAALLTENETKELDETE